MIPYADGNAITVIAKQPIMMSEAKRLIDNARNASIRTSTDAEIPPRNDST